MTPPFDPFLFAATLLCERFVPRRPTEARGISALAGVMLARLREERESEKQAEALKVIRAYLAG